jgi:hypothetical protein
MSQQIDLKARGLYTHPNALGSVPAGAMVIADNVVIDREDTTETRRGFKKFGTVLTAPIRKFFEYQSRIIVHHANILTYDSTGVGAWVNYSGTYASPTGATRMRSALANKNLYITTSNGVYKLDSLTGTPALAGVITALDGEGATTGATGWMSTNTQVAYRVVFGITDANNNKNLGSPSQRIIVQNVAGATRNIALTFTIPNTLTTSYFYQVYRSGQTPDLATEPTDELQLIVEKTITAGEITAGTATYTDETPDNLRGATLYTSPSQQGIEQANDRPPLAKDVTLFKNTMLYANTVGRQRLYITLISIGGTNGLQANDTITIGGTVYTAKVAENIANKEFQIFTGGTPSQNIDSTARSLIRVFNRNATNTTLYAIYLSGYAQIPGQLLIEERGVNGGTFVAISSRGTAFSPPLPASGSTYISANDVEPNAIYIAKVQQPEAVPLLSKVYAGAAQKAILRIIALRDSAYVIKEDGIFRITGTNQTDLQVTLLDGTTNVLAQESAVPFNNGVHAFSDQGIANISDSGVGVISRPIEYDIIKVSAEQFTNFENATFAATYESDRKYIYGTVTSTADTYSTQQYVYNSATQTWTRWILNMNCALVLTVDDKLYYGDAVNNFVYQERKRFDATDYAMEEMPVTITSSTGTTVNVNNTAGVNVGDTIAQFLGSVVIRESVITQIVSPTQIYVTDILTWTNNSATVYRPIVVAVKYTPIHGGNPAMVKLYEDLIMIFANANFNEMDLTFTSDQDISPETFTMTPTFSGQWGLFGWGSLGWGIHSGPFQTVRTLIPQNKARCHWFDLKIEEGQALTSFALVGISTFFNDVSEIQK